MIVLFNGDGKKKENVEEGGGETSYHVLFLYINSLSVISFSLVHGRVGIGHTASHDLHILSSDNAFLCFDYFSYQSLISCFFHSSVVIKARSISKNKVQQCFFYFCWCCFFLKSLLLFNVIVFQPMTLFYTNKESKSTRQKNITDKKYIQ